MSRLDEQSWQVVAAAQRYLKTGNSTEMNKFDIDTLKIADYQLGNNDLNTGWRKAIQDFIREKDNTPAVLEVKPEVYGIKLNLNELFKQIIKWFRK